MAEGGSFVWPGIRPGYTSVISDETLGKVSMTTVSLIPKVFTIEPLLTEEECNGMIESAEPQMRASSLTRSTQDGSEAVDVDAFRTSSQARFTLGQTASIERVERRAHRLLRRSTHDLPSL